MPIVQSSYSAPFFLPGGHLQTIIPAFRIVRGVRYHRERFVTSDNDFLDLDWCRSGSKRIVILSHGLEGNSQRPYILGMVRALGRNGWDALAWNYRGCSGEANRQLRWYHSGETEDLHAVISHVISQHAYEQIALVGFSLGGNMTLKYLGERAADVPRFIRAAVTFSVPCHLKSGALQLAKKSTWIYMRRFLQSLHEKICAKHALFPDRITDEDFSSIKTFMDFDNRYTAPIHGFKDADDYFARSSSRQFLPGIRIPTLLVSAKNDPFLGAECFPFSEAEANPFLFFESPETGGHNGFFTTGHEYWSETRAIAFLNSLP